MATTFPFYPLWHWYEPPPGWRIRQRVNGVDVWRTKILLPPRRTTAWRIAFDTSIALTSALTALSIPRVDITICLSPPVQTTLLGAAMRFKLGKLVMLVKDLPIEAARAVGMLDDGLMLRVGRMVESAAYRQASKIVVISGAFTTYIRGLGIEAARIIEIPDWANLHSNQPRNLDNPMRSRLGAKPGDFLIVHSGNMGAKQDLLNVVAAAALLQGQPQIRIVLIGDGTERATIAQAISSNHSDNVRLLPLQANDDFYNVLAAADALLVNQAPRVVDSVLPSKLLTYMASGRPVLAAADARSTTADVVRRAGCGIVVEPGHPETLAAAILSMASETGMALSLDVMGMRGREYVMAHFERESILRQWDNLVAELGSLESGR